MKLKLIRTFAPSLLSLKRGENDDELFNFAKNWRDISFVQSYLRANNEYLPKDLTLQEIAENCIDAVKDMLNTLKDGRTNYQNLFQPLSILERNTGNTERTKVKRNYMRLYALRVDDKYIITGGGLKKGQKMQDYTEGREELAKLEQLRNFLEINNVFDKESLEDFIAFEF